MSIHNKINPKDYDMSGRTVLVFRVQYRNYMRGNLSTKQLYLNAPVSQMTTEKTAVILQYLK